MKWFNHDVDARDNDKIFELIEAHGMMGYGLWWLILEELYKAEKTGFQIEATEAWFKRISKQTNLTDWRSLIRVLDTMSEQKLIDTQLWADHVIYAPAIAKRADEYIKKKAQNASRQAAFRNKHKPTLDKEKCVSNALLTHENEKSNDVTLSKAYSYSDSDSKTEEIKDKSARAREIFPDELVDPLISSTMPERLVKPVVISQFSAMQFEEFWQFSVPLGARSGKGLAKKKFMEIEGIEYKTFKDCYKKAIDAYVRKNPNEKSDEKFKYFKSLSNWIDAEGWLDFIPEHSQEGVMNLEMVLDGLPKCFRREVYVILPDGDWRVNTGLCSRAELSQFSMGSYRPEAYRRIYDIAKFIEENPDAVQVADLALAAT